MRSRSAPSTPVSSNRGTFAFSAKANKSSIWRFHLDTSIAASSDTVLIALHPLQRKTCSAVLIEIAGSLPMRFIGKPHPPQLGGGAVGGG